MKFDVQNALRNLDQRTPAFYRQELFSHGDLKVRAIAVEVLTDMDPEDRTSERLRTKLELV
ncbi:MAG: hypothetical protein KDD82_05520 [Planctomycetes bacterium]|nr:hypothetical protein [Planctomycetota bacterium]